MPEKMVEAFLRFLREKKGIVYDGPLAREFSEFSSYSIFEIRKLFDEINGSECVKEENFIASDDCGGIGHA